MALSWGQEAQFVHPKAGVGTLPGAFLDWQGRLIGRALVIGEGLFHGFAPADPASITSKSDSTSRNAFV
jgi:hypothetical protein